MNVNVINGKLNEDEINCYIKYIENKFPERELNSLNLKLDGDFIDMNYTFLDNIPFERIRRLEK